MVALVYHPAFDPYGSVLRSLRFLASVDRPIVKDELRLFDFLFLFPEYVTSMRLTTPLRSSWKKVIFRPRFRYEERPPAARIFGEMAPTFEAAYQTLGNKKVIKIHDSNDESFTLDRKYFPPNLASLVDERNKQEISLVEFLSEMSASVPFYGNNGLKDRSGLLEFRYDIV